MIRALAATLALLAVGGGCASPVGEEVEPLCVPGQKVFCRCHSGASATQLCLEDGMGFGSCGPCEGKGKAEGSAASGGDAEASGRPLFAPCTAASECATTICSDGYCTSPCYEPSDCPYPKSECVPNEASATCVPSCASDADCAGFGVTCKTGRAIDGWLVKTCR